MFSLEYRLAEAEALRILGKFCGAVFIRQRGDSGVKARALNDPPAHAEMLAIRAACAAGETTGQ